MSTDSDSGSSIGNGLAAKAIEGGGGRLAGSAASASTAPPSTGSGGASSSTPPITSNRTPAPSHPLTIDYSHLTALISTPSSSSSRRNSQAPHTPSIAADQPSEVQDTVSAVNNSDSGSAERDNLPTSATSGSLGPSSANTAVPVRDPSQPSGIATLGSLGDPVLRLNAAPHGQTDAMRVRANMLRTIWSAFGGIGRWRQYVLLFRLAIGLAQIVTGIVVMALPDSLGDSVRGSLTCDPEGMFVFLCLHTLRVACCLPIDFVLGLSPHRTPRDRRDGAEGLMTRERARVVGNLALDRKVSRWGDFLGAIHCVLFIFGNYAVFSSTECARPPADSVVLFWTSFAMLSISYIVIIELAILILAVAFFLPLVIVILRALGFRGRLEQQDIHPETAKVAQEIVEKLQLVYYTPHPDDKLTSNGEEAESPSNKQGAMTSQGPRSSLQDLRICSATAAWKDPLLAKDEEARYPHLMSQAIGTPLPPSRPSSPTRSEMAPARPDTTESIAQPEPPSAASPPTHAPTPQRSRLLFWRPRPASAANESAAGSSIDPATPVTLGPTASSPSGLRYPLHPIPLHRATCPICLCDFEEPSPRNASDKNTSTAAEAEEEPEPLRLLRCGHVLHRSCVDEWLTTVSGRCPVCQKPVLQSGAEAESADS